MDEKQKSGIAIVTGASSGIGTAFARHLATAAAGSGHYPKLPCFDELWLIARRGEKLGTLAEELRMKHGTYEDPDGQKLIIRTLTLDLVSEAVFFTIKSKIESTGKSLSILINNAGYGSYGPFSETDIDKQLGQIDLNCRSLTESCARLGSLLADNAVVINVASLAAFAPLGGFAVYAATKAYVLSLSVALAAEWKERKIRVSALCPGPVESEFALVASGGARTEVLHGWSADKTADKGLRAACKGRQIYVPRFSWKLQRFAASVFGPVISAVFAQKFLQRPHNKEEKT